MEKAEKIRKKNLLVVDDDEIFNMSMAYLVNNMEAINSCYIETNGINALNYLLSCKNSDLFPDFIFIDLNMPVLNGFHFIEFYERTYWVNHPLTKLYVISSSLYKKDKEKAAKFRSVTSFIIKPITSALLLDLINKS